MKTHKIRKIVSMITITAILFGSIPASAGDEALLDTFQDSLYGVLTGTLIGGATVAFTRKPANHLINMGIGAGAGAIGGAVFGLTKAVKTLVEIEDSRVRIALPTVIPGFVDSPSASSGNVAFTVGLIHVAY
jgi:hypothetical protein